MEIINVFDEEDVNLSNEKIIVDNSAIVVEKATDENVNKKGEVIKIEDIHRIDKKILNRIDKIDYGVCSRTSIFTGNEWFKIKSYLDDSKLLELVQSNLNWILLPTHKIIFQSVKGSKSCDTKVTFVKRNLLFSLDLLSSMDASTIWVGDENETFFEETDVIGTLNYEFLPILLSAMKEMILELKTDGLQDSRFLEKSNFLWYSFRSLFHAAMKMHIITQSFNSHPWRKNIEKLIDVYYTIFYDFVYGEIYSALFSLLNKIPGTGIKFVVEEDTNNFERSLNKNTDVCFNLAHICHGCFNRMEKYNNVFKMPNDDDVVVDPVGGEDSDKMGRNVQYDGIILNPYEFYKLDGDLVRCLGDVMCKDLNKSSTRIMITTDFDFPPRTLLYKIGGAVDQYRNVNEEVVEKWAKERISKLQACDKLFRKEFLSNKETSEIFKGLMSEDSLLNVMKSVPEIAKKIKETVSRDGTDVDITLVNSVIISEILYLLVF